MGFENRGNNKYYYRKRRVGGTVYSEYVGRGELAQLIARLDEVEQMEKEFERYEFAVLKERENRIDARLNNLGRLLRAITGAVLLAGGYHQHKRQWRKWRKRLRK